MVTRGLGKLGERWIVRGFKATAIIALLLYRCTDDYESMVGCRQTKTSHLGRAGGDRRSENPPRPFVKPNELWGSSRRRSATRGTAGAPITATCRARGGI